MKKLIVCLFLGLAFTNIGFAGSYGEDMKGECQKGKDSTRAQEEVVVADGSGVPAVESGSEVTGK